MNSTVRPNFKVIFVEKSICGSHKQYTGPTKKTTPTGIKCNRRYYIYADVDATQTLTTYHSCTILFSSLNWKATIIHVIILFTNLLYVF